MISPRYDVDDQVRINHNPTDSSDDKYLIGVSAIVVRRQYDPYRDLWVYFLNTGKACHGYLEGWLDEL